MLKDTTMIMGEYSYTANRSVSNIRYDVLLGVPWHKEENPRINYQDRTVKVNGKILSTTHVPEDANTFRIGNMSLKAARW